MLKADNKTIQNTYTKAAKSFDWAEGYMMNVLGLGRLRRKVYAPLRGDVLEVGAGTGLSFKYYPPQASVTALDLTGPMLDIAAFRAPKYGARLVQGDALALPFPDNSFDSATDSLCLCTYPDPGQALAEMARVVKPGGRIVLIEHGLARPRLLRWLQHKGVRRHFKTFCCRWDMDMDQLIAQSGLKVNFSRRTLFGAVYIYELSA